MDGNISTAAWLVYDTLCGQLVMCERNANGLFQHVGVEK